MSFRVSQSGQVRRATPNFQTAVAEIKFQARTVPGFGRGLLLGFLGGIVLGAVALGWVLPHVRPW